MPSKVPHLDDLKRREVMQHERVRDDERVYRVVTDQASPIEFYLIREEIEAECDACGCLSRHEGEPEDTAGDSLILYCPDCGCAGRHTVQGRRTSR